LTKVQVIKLLSVVLKVLQLEKQNIDNILKLPLQGHLTQPIFGPKSNILNIFAIAN